MNFQSCAENPARCKDDAFDGNDRRKQATIHSEFFINESEWTTKALLVSTKPAIRRRREN
jgi:hypothetical protein